MQRHGSLWVGLALLCVIVSIAVGCGGGGGSPSPSTTTPASSASSPAPDSQVTSSPNVGASPTPAVSPTAAVTPGPATVQVVLPTGTNLSLSSLQVQTGQGTASVAADGSVTVTLTDPTIAALVGVADANGNPVMIGLVGGEATSARIDVKETAAALMFYALGAFQLPSETHHAVLEELRVQPAVSDLAAVLQSEMARDPLVLTHGSPALEAAMTDALRKLTAIIGPSLTTARRVQPRTTPGLTIAGNLADLTLSPGDPQSGLVLVNGGSSANTAQPGTVNVINSYRRYAQLLLFKTGFDTVDGGGNVTTQTLTPPQLHPEVTDVSATQSLGSILGVLRQGLFLFFNVSDSTAFTPKTAGPVALPLGDGQVRARFKAVAAGATFSLINPVTGALNRGALPSDVTDGVLQPHLQSLVDASGKLTINAYLLDVLFPLIDTIVGANNAVHGAPNTVQTLASDVMSELQNTVGLSFPGIDIPNGTQTFSNAAFGGAIGYLIHTRQWTTLTRQIVQVALKDKRFVGFIIGLSFYTTAKPDSALLEYVSKAQGIITGVNLFLQSGDLTATLHDIGASNPLDVWDITAVPSKVVLNPVAADIDLSSGRNFVFFLECTAPGAGSQAFLTLQGMGLNFEWKVTGNAGGTLADSQHRGTTFDSTSGTVSYLGSDVAQPGQQDVVTVNVVLVLPGGLSGETIGSGKCVVTVRESPTPTPSPSPSPSASPTASPSPSPDGWPNANYDERRHRGNISTLPASWTLDNWQAGPNLAAPVVSAKNRIIGMDSSQVNTLTAWDTVGSQRLWTSTIPHTGGPVFGAIHGDVWYGWTNPFKSLYAVNINMALSCGFGRSHSGSDASALMIPVGDTIPCRTPPWSTVSTSLMAPVPGRSIWAPISPEPQCPVRATSLSRA